MTFDPTQPVVTAAGLLALKEFMHARGLDWRRAVEAVGIDPDIAVDIEAMVPLQAAFQLLENLARQSNNEAFGLQFGESLPANVTGALAYVTLNAPDLRTFCKDTVRFLGLVAYGYTARFEEGDSLSHIVYEIPHLHGPRVQFIDMICAASAMRLRHVAQSTDLEVHFDVERPAPKDPSEFHRVLGRNVRYGLFSNRVGIDTKLLSKPLPAADPHLYRIVRQHAEERIEKLEKTH
jgi:hypothetical protein